MLKYFYSERAKTLGKFKVPTKIPRIAKRKFTRVLHQFFALIKGFIFGAFSVLLLTLILNKNSYAQSLNSQCGGTSQPRCEVNVPLDDATVSAASNATANIVNYDGWLKGTINWTPNTNGFNWSFIPNIPTAACVNLQINSPVKSSSIEMDICSPFNKFQAFMNAVLSFFCVLGCVRQVESALGA